MKDHDQCDSFSTRANENLTLSLDAAQWSQLTVGRDQALDKLDILRKASLQTFSLFSMSRIVISILIQFGPLLSVISYHIITNDKKYVCLWSAVFHISPYTIQYRILNVLVL